MYCVDVISYGDRLSGDVTVDEIGIPRLYRSYTVYERRENDEAISNLKLNARHDMCVSCSRGVSAVCVVCAGGADARRDGDG